MTVESAAGWKMGLDLLGPRMRIDGGKSFGWFREEQNGQVRWRHRLVPLSEGNVRWDEGVCLPASDRLRRPDLAAQRIPWRQARGAASNWKTCWSRPARIWPTCAASPTRRSSERRYQRACPLQTPTHRGQVRSSSIELRFACHPSIAKRLNCRARPEQSAPPNAPASARARRSASAPAHRRCLRRMVNRCASARASASLSPGGTHRPASPSSNSSRSPDWRWRRPAAPSPSPPAASDARLEIDRLHRHGDECRRGIEATQFEVGEVGEKAHVVGTAVSGCRERLRDRGCAPGCSLRNRGCGQRSPGWDSPGAPGPRSRSAGLGSHRDRAQRSGGPPETACGRALAWEVQGGGARRPAGRHSRRPPPRAGSVPPRAKACASRRRSFDGR